MSLHLQQCLTGSASILFVALLSTCWHCVTAFTHHNISGSIWHKLHLPGSVHVEFWDAAGSGCLQPQLQCSSTMALALRVSNYVAGMRLVAVRGLSTIKW